MALVYALFTCGYISSRQGLGMATVNGNDADTCVVYNYVVQSNIVLVPFKVYFIFIAKYVSHKYDVMYYFHIYIGVCPKFCIINIIVCVIVHPFWFISRTWQYEHGSVCYPYTFLDACLYRSQSVIM